MTDGFQVEYAFKEWWYKVGDVWKTPLGLLVKTLSFPGNCMPSALFWGNLQHLKKCKEINLGMLFKFMWVLFLTKAKCS